jgi:Sulfotransferase family
MTITHAASCPIFLLGMGRCGSTFQQVVLTKITDIWIWGEHDGMLAPVIKWLRATKESRDLRRFSFVTDPAAVTEMMDADSPGISTRLAWLNAFRANDLDKAARNLICTIFETGLPSGKTRWGFKEIRYGPADRAAEGLLDLFPCARIIHTVRHPIRTIESCLLTWHRPDMQEALKSGNQSSIDDLYRRYANRWAAVTGYYLELSARYPLRVRSSKLETFWDDLPETLGFIEAEPILSLSTAQRDRVNSLNIDAGDLEQQLEKRRTLATAVVAEHARTLDYSLAEGDY